MKIRNHGNGLAEDLRLLEKRLDRRQLLQLFAGAGAASVLVGCGSNAASLGGEDAGTGSGGSSGSGGSAGSGGSSTGGTSSAGICSEIPTETGGPYPGDGTNGPNALTTDGILRTDIRKSFGSLSGTAAGIPLTIALTVVNVNGSCAPLADYAVYVWHCDRDGHYSLYTAADQNYLRGVAETDDTGLVTFTSIFPACYSGRWPHIHFEIFTGVDSAMSGNSAVKTSQLAMPKASCDEVFQTDGYSQSITNLSQITMATDNVFSDGATLETPVITGDTTDGYVITLTVGVKA